MNSYEALRTRAAWIDLSARGKIRVTGEDRARLLHAMTTNDIQHMQPGDGLYAFFLNAQGRILADAYLYNLGESFLLDTEPETAGKVLQHLDKYIIADDVAQEDQTAIWKAVGIEGPASARVIEALSLPAPAVDYHVAAWENGFTARTAATGPLGFRVFVPVAERAGLIERIAAAGIPEADVEAARTVRLENGRPRYGEDITERYLTQETQQMHAVSFTKGCYLGQEIVERVRSRAQVHRHLMPVHIRSTQAPAAGAKLKSDGKDAAEITSAAFSPALGEVVALAYVRTDYHAPNTELTVDSSEPPVTAYIP
jgi:tRNA-modifying protein YgfZ